MASARPLVWSDSHAALCRDTELPGRELALALLSEAKSQY